MGTLLRVSVSGRELNLARDQKPVTVDGSNRQFIYKGSNVRVIAKYDARHGEVVSYNACEIERYREQAFEAEQRRARLDTCPW